MKAHGGDMRRLFELRAGWTLGSLMLPPAWQATSTASEGGDAPHGLYIWPHRAYQPI